LQSNTAASIWKLAGMTAWMRRIITYAGDRFMQLIEFATNHALLVMAFAAVVLLLLWSELSQRGQGFKVLTTTQAVAFMNREGARVVDISPPADFAKGHIVGARNLLPSRLSEPDKDVLKLLETPLLVVCKSGQTSVKAAAALVKQGAKDVAALKGGVMQWTADQYPVTRG
jgi:rhodanese-related sulfurtransferase